MFGKSYMLDMYRCREGVCDDLELHYRFLEELVHVLGMIPMSPPLVLHAPTKFETKIEYDLLNSPESSYTKRIELYPDKEGVSGWQSLVTSGIQVHSCEPSHFSCIDVFSCGDFQTDKIKAFAHKFFGFEDSEEYVVNRGLKYGT